MKRLIKVQYKRRRQNKTDYLARRNLLESGVPRLVVRKTNRYILAQVIQCYEARDKIICSANSKELVEYGLKPTFSIKNLSASYLTGYLCSLRAIGKNIKKVILDIGLQRSTKGSKLYALAKGAIDAGIELNCSEEMFPAEIEIDDKILSKIKEKHN